VKLDGSTFKDRQLKVTPKRVNDPNFYSSQQQTGFAGGYQGRGRGGGRGGGFRGRGGGGFGKGARFPALLVKGRITYPLLYLKTQQEKILNNS